MRKRKRKKVNVESFVWSFFFGKWFPGNFSSFFFSFFSSFFLHFNFHSSLFIRCRSFVECAGFFLPQRAQYDIMRFQHLQQFLFFTGLFSFDVSFQTLCVRNWFTWWVSQRQSKTLRLTLNYISLSRNGFGNEKRINMALPWSQTHKMHMWTPMDEMNDEHKTI